MIASKLILIFCLYLLLLLDYSLGQKPLIAQFGNKELFKAALDFGATYRGELGLLGSEWKQLLIQLVHAKQNVGLGKVQLTRFNNSATTEEVGLVIPASYADKVSELVAIRTEDIGATQQYIDELEILKNEIALTMIVEMDEIEAQFKEKNVREKVKEAKENGLTDTDIKEILFTNFFGSEGLSLIGAGASVAEALLSSFLNGMKRILSNSKEPGIIQYGNVIGCLPCGDCVGERGGDGGNNNGAGGDQPERGGGGGNLGGAAGGDEPPDRGGRPPYYLPNGKIGDIDDQEETSDRRINDDIDEFFREFMASLPEGVRVLSRRFPEEQLEGSREERLETWLFNLNGAGLGVEVEMAAGFNRARGAVESNDDSGFFATPAFPDDVVAKARVLMGMKRRRMHVKAFENAIKIFRQWRYINYFNSQEYREPNYGSLSSTERARILNARISGFENLLGRARQLNSELHEYRIIFQRNYYRARDNVYFYAHLVGWNLDEVPLHIRTFPSPPPPLPEFQCACCESHQLRYSISIAQLLRLLTLGERLQIAFNDLGLEIDQLERRLNNETALLRDYNVRRTHEDDDSS